MKTTTDSITLTIHDIEDSIEAAIHAACQESDYLSSGEIGPSFACSGPGSGWQRNFDESDYAERALNQNYGATGYVDSSNGRLATLDADGDVVWSATSVVELIAPKVDEIDQDLKTAKMMIAALKSEQCVEGPGDWSEARALIAVSEADALSRIDGDLVRNHVIYFDDGTGKWYCNHRQDLIGLRELMGSTDEDIARDAYSHWCAGYPSDGEFGDRDAAVGFAEKQ